MKYLGVDYGEKRVGIAVSDENMKYSFSRDFIINDESLFDKLFRIIREEKVVKIILGHPLNLKADKTAQTLKVEDFREKLSKFLITKSLECEIIFFDERLTSRMAESYIRESGLKKSRRRNKGLVDSTSAQIILQDYIDKTNKSQTN